MNPTLAQAVSFALDVAVKSTLVFAAAAALLFALRRASAATRHLVGTFGLAAALLVPFLTLALPQVRVRLLPDPRPAVRTAAPLSRVAERTARPAVAEPASSGDAIEETSDDPITVDVVAPAPAAVADAKTLRRLARAVPERAVPAADPSALAPAAAPPRPLRLPSAGAVLAAVLGLWALGALAFATRLAVGWVRVRRIARAASPLTDAEWIEERDAAARRLSLDRHVPLVESESVPVAVTSGWRRPLLLIGHAARSWAVERKRVVLLHELAHVKRADWPALLVAELAVATYWFHPAAWWLGRRVRREAEQACDDLVISSGTKPSVYAGHLLGIFRALHSPAHPVAPALAIARPHHFEERLRAILDPVSARGAVSGATARFAAAGLFVAAMSFSAIEPWKDSAPHRSPSTPPASASLAASASESQSETASPKAREEQSSLVAVVFRKIANRVARKVEQRVETNVEAKESAAFQHVTETKAEKAVCESRKKEKSETTPDSGEAVTPEPEAEPEPESMPAVLKEDGKTPLPSKSGFVKASNRHPKSGNDWYGRGMDLHHDEDYEAAIEAFKKAIELGYNEDASSYNIACGYALLGNNDAAFEWLKKAMDEGFDVASYMGRDDDLESLKSDPRWAQTKKDARSQEGSKSQREAKAVANRYQRLLSRNPKGGEPFFDVGIELLRADEYDLAAQAYQQAIDRGFRTGTAYYNQACAYALGGDKDKAFDALQKAIGAGFDQPDHLAKDDDLDSLHGDPRFSDIKRQAKELELPSYNSGYWGHRASDRKKWREAAKRFEAYVQKNPDSGRGWYSVGFAALAGDRPEDSIEAFQKALALGYRKSTTMYNIACAYSRLDQKDAAFEWLFKALDAGFDQAGTIRNDEDLDNLRGDARYRKALSIARAKERGESDGDTD